MEIGHVFSSIPVLSEVADFFLMILHHICTTRKRMINYFLTPRDCSIYARKTDGKIQDKTKKESIHYAWRK